MNAPEPWMDKRKMAAHLSCSVRTIDRLIADGCPHAVILGRVRVRVSEVEAWLATRGSLRRRGTLPNPQQEAAA